MTQSIQFGCWAPDEATFWNTWVAAGIATKPNVLAPGYDNCIQTTADSWHGIVTRDGVAVPGWHCNVRVFGALAAQFTAGCPPDGSIWERTRAADVFGLTYHDADAETGFPAGMRTATGVIYADASDFRSPSNVWA